MATPVGHVLGGLGAYTALAPREPLSTKRALLVAAAVLSPDSDVILLFFGVGEHRGWTHSLLFCAAVSIFVWLLVRGWRSRAPSRLFLALLAATTSHLLLDWLMHCGPPIQPFYPLSKHGFNCPVQLIPTAYYATTPKGLIHILLMPETLVAIMLEMMSLGPLVVLSFLLRSGKVRWSTAFALFALSSVGFILTFLIYN